VNRSGEGDLAEPMSDLAEPIADPAEPVTASAAASGYELEAVRISSRSSRPTIAAAAAIAGLLAIAIAVALFERGGGHATDAGTVGRPSAGRPSAQPAAVHCHDLAAGPCGRVAAAAVDVMGPGAPVQSIDVWRSLLCGDDLDCPPGRLAGLRPLGSAVVVLGDAEPAGWVNVGERLAVRGAEPALVAWLIR